MFTLLSEPQSIGKVLDSGIKLFLASFKYIVLMVILANGLYILPSILLAGLEPDAAASMATVSIILLIVFYFVYMLLYLAVTYRMWGIATNNDPGFSGSIKRGFACLLPVILAFILYFIAVLLGMIALIIPGIILMLSLSFFYYCILLNGDGIIESFKHSHRLVWGNWWRAAVILTIPLFIMISLYVVVGIIFGVSLFQDPEAYAEGSASTILFEIANATIGVFTGPLFMGIALALFNDLKLRKEGGDLEQQVESLGSS